MPLIASICLLRSIPKDLPTKSTHIEYVDSIQAQRTCIIIYGRNEHILQTIDCTTRRNQRSFLLSFVMSRHVRAALIRTQWTAKTIKSYRRLCLYTFVDIQFRLCVSFSIYRPKKKSDADVNCPNIDQILEKKLFLSNIS